MKLSPKKLESHILETDFAVIGGGLSGICAALAAARNGARVVLVQDRSVLGGNASSEVKMHIVGADCHGSRTGAREAGIIEEFRLEDAVRNPYRSYAQWDLLLYEKVKAEPNITLLLDTTCISCTKEEATNAITSVTALRNSTDDVFEINAKIFADCSGDSRLALEADADYHVGREAKSDFGESLAQDVADRQTLGSSILITGKKHDTPQPFIAPDWVREFTPEQLKHRPIKGYEYGYWWFEWGGHLNTVKDNEAIRHELLRIALGIWNFIKNSGYYPDAANWTLDWVGSLPAKRESRRLLAPAVLRQQDVQEGRIFEDAVAYGGWWIDTHPPMGVDAPEEEPCNQHHCDRIYTIPWSVLHSRNIPNLVFAGRNISATHIAFASTRVMATCAVMGQAIGTAAAQVVARGVPLEQLDIPALQQQLMKDDAYLPTFPNTDVNDHARTASVRASGHLPGHAPELVLDGVTRDLNHPTLGSWADGKPHHWASAPALPAWIELDFGKEIALKEIHLTFDSGFARELILSCSDSHNAKSIRGAQPETVKDYRLYAGDTLLLEVHGNYQRKRIHTLPEAVQTDTLRLEVLATNGDPSARVFEIRAYSR